MTIDEKIHILQGQVNAIKIALGSGGGGELPSDLDARLKQVEQDVAELTLEVAAAQNTADGAQQTATSAQSAATTAQEAANSAEALAEVAKTAADNALSVADGAIDMAQEASGKADAAQTSAEVAKTTADNAQASADTAKSTADNALSTASDVAHVALEANRTAQDAQSLAVRKQAQLLYLHKIQINFERVQETTATNKGINFLTGFFTLRSTSPDALSGDDIFDRIIVRSRINPITLVGTAQDQQLFASFVLYQIEKPVRPLGALTFVGTYFVDGENIEFRVQCQRSALDTSRIIDTVVDYED